MKYLLVTLILMQGPLLFAQNESNKKLTWSGYGEIYYSYDFSNPQNHEKENFIYNHKRHNELNLNLLILKAQYVDKNMRANLAFMSGNYAQYNLSSESSWVQMIYEANVGLKLSKQMNIWLDAGIMPSHIGFESAVSADCWTLTRSIAAENSPYYESGLKLSFTSNKKNLSLAFLLLNGWQRVKKPAYYQSPSFGLQFNYKPHEKLLLNYSNFIGTDKADSMNALRIFHNLYAQIEPRNKVALIAGFDLGTDKYNASDYGVWFSPVIIVRYTLTNKFKIAFRGEYYDDKHQIIISTNHNKKFEIAGLSSNFDYQLNEKIQWRFEGKMFYAKESIFQNNERTNYSVTTNLTMKL